MEFRVPIKKKLIFFRILFIWNKVLYLCRVFAPAPIGWCGNRHIFRRRLLNVLSSSLQTSQLWNHIRRQGSGRCLRDLYQVGSCVVSGAWKHSYTISAWASALLILIWWAMRRPEARDKWQAQFLTLFLYICIIYHEIITAWVGNCRRNILKNDVCSSWRYLR